MLFRSVTFGIIRALGIVLCCLAPQALADTLMLQDGTPLQGEYRGGSPAEIRFLVNGEEQAYKIEDVQSLTIRPRVQSQKLVLPTGTVIQARLETAISSRRNRNGDRFTMRLTKPLGLANVTVAESGHRVVGRVSRVRRARSSNDTGFLQVVLQELEIDGEPVFLRTGTHKVITRASDGIEERRGEVRIAAGTVLQFRLLQSIAVQVERR